MRLKWLIDDLTEQGVDVMLSNSPHPRVVGLYEGSRYHIHQEREIEEEHEPNAEVYDIARIPARRVINSRGDRRGAIDELLVTNAEWAARSRAASSAG